MGWHERLVYYRDFAYSTPRLRMANGNIGHVPAQTFAEYVDDPFLDGDGDGDGGAPGEALSDVDAHEAPRARCLTVRPALSHRLYSHRLHVRAKAKLHRDRLLSGPMVDIYVGEARRRWTLHRTLLCHHSEQLEAELEGSGPADRKDALELPEHDPAGFELLVKWLYQGTLDDVADLPDATQQYEYAVRCHGLYLLCERLDMAPLKNVAMDQFRRGLNESRLVPDADELDDLYRKSPPGSPFRRLLVQIAARQIMDPDSDHPADAYRRCFAGSPDFAVELVHAIRQGTGGMLLADPTERGSECEYHDHDDRPHCNVTTNIKARARAKATAKHGQSPRRPLLRQVSSTLHKLRPAEPPSPPASPAVSPPASPRKLRRRSSTPSPHKPGDVDRGDLGGHGRRESSSQPGGHQGLGQAQEGHHTGGAKATSSPRRAPPKLRRRPRREGRAETTGSAHQSPPRRGIWEWARAGTGRLNMIGRLPHPEWKSPGSAPQAAGLAVNGAQQNGKTTQSHDDFDIPSPTATEPDNIERQDTVAAAKIQGLGITPFATLTPPTDFSQTAGSSDDLIANASETTGSPSPLLMKHGSWTNGTDGDDDTTPTASKPASPTTPDTPTPPQQRRCDSIIDMAKTREITRDTVSRTLQNNIAALTPGSASSTHADSSNPKTPKEPEANANETPSSAPAKANGSANSSQRRIPTYKIALVPSLLSPKMRNASRSASAAH
ncbi:uncharacterized protein M421DRAFT_71450 [Didymella exigua CBS 183.55]|uniref:BTB domain-containing protein n=1 Tax=Didymella exigua CBS 183.55 TaxID=1150837 RepID=A0A6A5RCZ7_9PLEO|nr:uncharacterized protein M421DRAFT_71450 [Didymella exigua CBS 183.55]KAF1924964.1 hypothetical protein M421DRAFT_71450 [Didymella exigua CBS 183.55]